MDLHGVRKIEHHSATVAAWAPSSSAESGRSRETAADPSDASNRSNTSKKQQNLIARIFFLIGERPAKLSNERRRAA
jgi:hypothetical protein